MSMSDDHVRSTQIITFGPPEEDKRKKCDSFFINKKVNGWNLILDVNEFGKITMIGSKTLEKLAAIGNEATIKLSVETTDNRAPQLKTIGSRSKYEVEFVEVDNEKKIKTESFKQNEFYKHQYDENSSILTPDEFFTEMIPEFEQLLKDKKIEEYVSQISDSVSKVQKPFTRTYVKTKLEK